MMYKQFVVTKQVIKRNERGSEHKGSEYVREGGSESPSHSKCVLGFAKYVISPLCLGVK